MKNVKRLFIAALALVSASSMAFVQPGKPASEDAPFRFNVGLKGNLHNYRAPTTTDKDAKKFGMSEFGGGLSFSHLVGSGFEYGIGISTGWSSMVAPIFTEGAKENSGQRIDIDLMARFMPEVADGFYFGAQVDLGWGKQFGKFANELAKDIAFGDMRFGVGPAFNFDITEMFSIYFLPKYTLTEIRFAKADVNEEKKDAIKEVSNLSGMELPLGFWFNVGDNVGVFLDVNTAFTDFRHMKETWSENLSLGVSVAI